MLMMLRANSIDVNCLILRSVIILHFVYILLSYIRALLDNHSSFTKEGCSLKKPVVLLHLKRSAA